MRHFPLRSLVAASALAAFGCLHAPMPWSPDGKWMAYTVEVRPIGQILLPGWSFESAVDGSARDRSTPRSAPTSYRLWATRADSGDSVLLEDSPGPLTAPGWSPDGRALAFGRAVPVAEGSGGRFEVVILEGPTRRRIISSRALPVIGSGPSPLPAQAVAWSPDGRYLAVPQLGPDGLAILRADNGRQVNAINDAFLPSWSPDGAKLAFYVRGTTDSLHCIDSALGQPRLLAEVGQAGQAPIWTRDGQTTLVIVARQPAPRNAEGPGDLAHLIRVRVDSGASEVVRPLSPDSVMGRDRSAEGVSLAVDREGENLFCSNVADGQPNQITWVRLRDGAVYKKFYLVDFTIPMGSLSLSPDGRTLAARVGTTDRLSAPALCDLESNDLRTRLIAPDDSTRVEWIATLVRSARLILGALPAAGSDRPTILPVLGEFEANSEILHRLRRIGRAGRPLCDRPASLPPASPELAALLDEARLFFDYLRRDYGAALDSLETLEARAETPDRRSRLLSVRAQLFLAQGMHDRAAHAVDYLRDRQPRPRFRLEVAGGKFSLTPETIPGRGWPDYLRSKVEAARVADQDVPTEPHLNPDAPRGPEGFELPGIRLDLERPPFDQPPTAPRQPSRRVVPGGIPR